MRLHNLLERMIVSSKQNSYPTLSQHVIELNFKSMQTSENGITRILTEFLLNNLVIVLK